MWNSKHGLGYKSLFLLVRVRSGRFRFTLPLALFLIDETLEIFTDLLWLVGKLIPVRIGGEYSYCGSERKKLKGKNFREQGFSPHEIIDLCRELLGELRRHGRYSLVEVKTGTGLHKESVLVELF